MRMYALLASLLLSLACQRSLQMEEAPVESQSESTPATTESMPGTVGNGTIGECPILGIKFMYLRERMTITSTREFTRVQDQDGSYIEFRRIHDFPYVINNIESLQRYAGMLSPNVENWTITTYGSDSGRFTAVAADYSRIESLEGYLVINGDTLASVKQVVVSSESEIGMILNTLYGMAKLVFIPTGPEPINPNPGSEPDLGQPQPQNPKPTQKPRPGRD